MHTPRPEIDAGAPVTGSLAVRVYYEDTDAAGVVYYANYLRFCERARTEWLRAAGFEQQALLAERRIAFVVRSVGADYLSAAMLDDALHVLTTVDEVGGARLTFVQRVVRGTQELFRGRFVIACVDLDRKRPTPIPADMRAQLHKLVQA